MSPGNIQKQPNLDDEDDDDEPLLRYPEHPNDHNLVWTSSTINAKSTLIPKPYSGRTTVAPIQSKKNNIPSGPQPRDHFHLVQQPQKKRVLDEALDLTGPNGKRQNTNTRSRVQGDTFKEKLHGESYETVRETETGTNRSIMGKLKSEHLKESLAGGSSPNKVKSVVQEQEETGFEIPLERYQEWKANRRGLDAPGSEDDVAIESGSKTAESPKNIGRQLRMEDGIKETQWDGKNPLPLTRFRRGKFILLDDTRVSIILDSHANFRVYEGGRELEGYGFPSKRIKYLHINEMKDYVGIVLDRRDSAIPNGEQIWWKLAAPCPDIEKTFSKYTQNNISPEIRKTAWIEERENKFKSLTKEDPIYKANPNPESEAPRREHLDILNSDQPKESRTLRNTRSRNAQVAKRVTTIEVEDVDTYSTSPTKPRVPMTKAERDLPPLVWPLSGKKRVTVEFQDLERLQEEQFLNDNIINFYLRYLEEELARENPAVAKQTYWFNTFFYERLSQKTTDRKANLRALMKWTARVDLFAKQYVIIPINENAHWYLAIICNLPHLERKLQSRSGQDNQGEEATTIPTPDSPGGEDEISSEVELPSMPQIAVESPDRMGIDDPNLQRPATAEEQLLSELNHHEPENLPSSIHIDEPVKGDEDEWPNEEGLEGVSDQYISELELPHNQEQVQDGDEEIIVPTHGHDKKRGKKQKAQPARAKKLPKPVHPNSPTIIILDSLGNYGHSRTFSLLREYLEEEALDKKQWEAIRRAKIEGLYAIVPQQPNFCDCGVYLLYYVERFLQRPEEFTQEFLQKRDTKAHFDSDQFSGMRLKLHGLIEKLHYEQHNVPAETDASNHRSIPTPSHTDSRRDNSEETQEVRHAGGGPRSVEHGVLTKENGHWPRESSQDVDLVNIIQSRRFTPERDGEPTFGSRSTSSRRISHVEIPNKGRTSSPPSLRSSSSPEHIPTTKEEKNTPWYRPLSAQESTSPSEPDEYAISVD